MSLESHFGGTIWSAGPEGDVGPYLPATNYTQLVSSFNYTQLVSPAGWDLKHENTVEALGVGEQVAASMLNPYVMGLRDF